VFERFTERARQVVVLAQDEARTLKHGYIGTEHLLLGLLREQEGMAALVLASLDITLDGVRARVLELVGPGDGMKTGQVPFTPQAKESLNLSLREALSLGHSYISTEHILLGLVREGSGVGARILLDLDADFEKVRNEIIRLLSGPGRRETTVAGGEGNGQTEGARWVVVLAEDEARDLQHAFVGTEHLLLGLLREEQGVAARVLTTLGLTVEEVRAQVARIVAQGDEAVTGQIPFTPRAKKVLDLARHEALSLGEASIDTEHILLGLVRENEGVAARILVGFDADAERIRNAIIRMLSGSGDTPTGRRRITIGYDQSAQLLVACPNCATPIETITTDRPNTRFNVSAEGDRTCAGCGKQWTISYTVSWDERLG
jgi:ATP-dependent Clp protease ATP-binding subunit ClpA